MSMLPKLRCGSHFDRILPHARHFHATPLLAGQRLSSGDERSQLHSGMISVMRAVPVITGPSEKIAAAGRGAAVSSGDQAGEAAPSRYRKLSVSQVLQSVFYSSC